MAVDPVELDFGSFQDDGGNQGDAFSSGHRSMLA
jgi:hypothetical protein